MSAFKVVANQKVIKVEKQVCDKNHIYTQFNLKAFEMAAVDLDAGAFKLWCYIAKNQNGYEFALSSSDAEKSFGLKKKQYDNAVKQLIEKHYLVVSKGYNYTFNEIPVVPKGNNDVVSKGNKDVVSKGNNTLYPKDTRNITDTTINTTKNITGDEECQEEGNSIENPIEKKVSEFTEEEKGSYQQTGLKGVMKRNKKYYKVIM